MKKLFAILMILVFCVTPVFAFQSETIWYKGSDLSDSGIAGMTLTSGATTAYASGKLGNAFLFDGSESSAPYHADNDAYDYGSEWSMSFWLYDTSKVASHIPLSRYNVTGWQIDINASTGVVTIFNGEGYTKEGAIDVANSTWNLIIMQRQADGKVYLYINNVTDGAGTTDSASYDFSTQFYIGAHAHDTLYPMNAGDMIDDVRIWKNASLSATERNLLWNNGTGYNYSLNYTGSTNVTSGLVGYWKLNETTGDTAYDISGNGLDGTYIGAVTHTNDSVQWDENTAEVFVPYNELLNITEDISVTGWLYYNGTGDYVWIASRGYSDSFEFYVTSAGFYRSSIYGSECSGTLPIGEWIFVSMIQNATDTSYGTKFYSNNGSTVCTAPSGNRTPSSTNLSIGNRGFNLDDTSIYAPVGTMQKNVRIYNRVLTTEEIQQIYAEEQPPAPIEYPIEYYVNISLVSPANASTGVLVNSTTAFCFIATSNYNETRYRMADTDATLYDVNGTYLDVAGLGTPSFNEEHCFYNVNWNIYTTLDYATTYQWKIASPHVYDYDLTALVPDSAQTSDIYIFTTEDAPTTTTTTSTTVPTTTTTVIEAPTGDIIAVTGNMIEALVVLLMAGFMFYIVKERFGK